MTSLARVQTTDPALKTGEQAAAVPAGGGTRDTTAVPPGLSNRALQTEAGAAAAPIRNPVEYAADWVADAGEKDELDGILLALTGHDEAFSKQLETTFAARHHKHLRSYLQAKLWGDRLVEAYGLLRFPKTIAPACQMARALIASGVRDEQILTLLYQCDLPTRKRLKQEYDLTYGSLGNHGLENDLRAAYQLDTSTWIMEKALIMLERDLTPADEMYFLTEGITGTKTEEALKLLQDEWAKGPERIAKMVRDWDELIKGKGLSEYDLEMAIWQETVWEAGRAKTIMQLVFGGYHRWLEGGLNKPGPKTDAEKAQERDIQARVAFGTLRIATAGLGRKEEQVFRAADDLYRVRVGAIMAAEKGGNQTDQAWGAWEAERKKFLAELAGELEPGSADYERVRLTLMADPRAKTRQAAPQHELPTTADITSLTDQLYAAWKLEGDYAKSAGIIKKAWATGQIDHLRKDAATGKTVGGAELRKPFPLHLVVTMEHAALVESGWNDERRGGRQLWVELWGDSEDALRRGYAFLTQKEVSESLREGVIREVVAWKLESEPGKTPRDKLWSFIQRQYPPDAPTRFDCEMLLKPPQDDEAKLNLLKRKRHATAPGWFTDMAMTDWDAITSEDREEIQQEEERRLEYLLDLAKRDKLALDWLKEQTGAKSVEELIAKGFDAYEESMGNFMALKRTVVGVGATAAQLVVGAALTYLTAGTALAFLPGIAATLTGMGVKKAGLGGDVDLFSDENITTLAMDVASQVTGGLLGAGLKGLLTPQVMAELKQGDALFKVWQTAELSKKAQFFQSTVTEFTTSTMNRVVTGKKLPTADELAQKLALIMTGQKLGQLGEAAREKLKRAGSVLSEEFYPAVGKGLITGTGEVVLAAGVGGFKQTPEAFWNDVNAMVAKKLRAAATATAGAVGKSRRANVEKAAEKERKLTGAATGGEAGHSVQVYEAARQGGPNAGFYKQYRNKSTDQVEAAIREQRERITKAEAKLVKPEEAHKQWNDLTFRAQQDYKEIRQAEIQKTWEQIQVLEGILREREVAPALFQHQ